MSEFTFQVKQFSPLRTPDVFRHKKKKVAKKEQNDIEGYETDVTKDLRILAKSVQESTKTQIEDSDGFVHSDRLPDLDKVPRSKLKMLDSRLTAQKPQNPDKSKGSKGEIKSKGPLKSPTKEKNQESALVSKDSTYTSLVMSPNKESPSKKKKRHSSFTESLTESPTKKLKDDQQQSVRDLSEHNTSRVKSPNKESPTKRKKRRHSSVTDSSIESPRKKLKEAPHQSVHVMSSGSDDESSQSDASQPSKNDILSSHSFSESIIASWSDDSDYHHSGVIELSQSETQSSYSFSYKKDGFEKSSLQLTKSQLSLEDIKGKELWLIKAPVDMDIQSLDKTSLNISQPTSVCSASKDVSYDVHVSTDESSLMSMFCPLLPSRQTLEPRPAPEFVGRIDLVPRIEVPPLPEISIPTPIVPVLPTDLRPRFTPFGSDKPVTKETTPIHKKKHKKEKVDSSSDRKKKKSKKYKK